MYISESDLEDSLLPENQEMHEFFDQDESAPILGTLYYDFFDSASWLKAFLQN